MWNQQYPGAGAAYGTPTPHGYQGIGLQGYQGIGLQGYQGIGLQGYGQEPSQHGTLTGLSPTVEMAGIAAVAYGLGLATMHFLGKKKRR